MFKFYKDWLSRLSQPKKGLAITAGIILTLIDGIGLLLVLFIIYFVKKTK